VCVIQLQDIAGTSLVPMVVEDSGWRWWLEMMVEDGALAVVNCHKGDFKPNKWLTSVLTMLSE
jgi:hypothetical protein